MKRSQSTRNLSTNGSFPEVGIWDSNPNDPYPNPNPNPKIRDWVGIWDMNLDFRDLGYDFGFSGFGIEFEKFGIWDWDLGPECRPLIIKVFWGTKFTSVNMHLFS